MPSSWRAAATWPLCTGSKVPPKMPMVPAPTPSPRAGKGPGGRLSLRIVDELHIRNPHRLPAVSAVAREGVVQPPAIEHALEMREPLGIGHVSHGQQPLELVAGDQKPTLDRLDRKGFGRGWTAIDLERGQRMRHRLTLALLEHAPRRPEQVLDPFTGGGRDGEGAPAKLDQALSKGEHLRCVRYGVHLVQRDQMGAARQSRAVFLELGAHLLVVAPQLVLVAGGGVDDVDQHAGAIDVAKELQAEARSGVRTFDQAGQVRHDEGGVLCKLDDAEHGLEGREGIVGDLRFGGAGGGEERRFAGVWQPEQADIGDQSQLQPEPGGLPRLAQLGEARRLAGRRLEAGIAAATPPAPGDDEALPLGDQVGDRFSLLILDQRPGGNLQHDVDGVLSVPPAATASAAAAGGEVMLEAIVLQGVELPRDLEDDIAATAAVPTIRAPSRHELLAAEAQGTGASVATLHEDLDPVRKHQYEPSRVMIRAVSARPGRATVSSTG